MSQHSKLYHNKVEELKVKMFVATKKFMPRQFLGAEKFDKLVATKFYVATQDTPIVTRTRLLRQNYVMTLSKFVTIESNKKHRKLVTTENVGHDKIWGTKIKTLSLHNFLCRDRATNWTRIFGDSQSSLEVLPIIGKSINRHI